MLRKRPRVDTIIICAQRYGDLSILGVSSLLGINNDH